MNMPFSVLVWVASQCKHNTEKKYAWALRLSNTCATGIRCVVHSGYLWSICATFSSYWSSQMKTSLVWNCHPHNEARKSPVDSPKRAASSPLQKERREKKTNCADRGKPHKKTHCVPNSLNGTTECVDVICIETFWKDISVVCRR